MWAIVLTFLGSLVGLWAVIRYIVLIDFRIDNSTFRTVYDYSKSQSKFILEEELSVEGRAPVLFMAFCWFKKAPIFFIHHGERLMQAGWQSKDAISTVICFRWRSKKLRTFFREELQKIQLEQFGIPVELVTPWQMDKIGSLKVGPPPLNDPKLWQDFEAEVAEVKAGKRLKTSGIFHGPPGNGKTSLIKYLALKYGFSIKLITFCPEFANYDIMFMFSQITPNSIVLLEDFDNYFNGRKCLIGSGENGSNNNIKFTFDVVLNCLDGIYNSYEGVVFIMTANDIDKIDGALRHRPSRFKYVRKFDNPTLEERTAMIGDWAAHTNNLSLDQILRMKEFKELGWTLEESLGKLELKLKENVPITADPYC